MMKRCLTALAAVVLLAACGESSTGPEAARIRLERWGSDIVYAPATGNSAALRVIARHATTNEPIADEEVSWSVVAGSATLVTATTTSNIYGLAETTLSGGSGTVRVRASHDRLTGDAPEIEVRFVPAPVIAAIAPAPAVAGSTISITGTGFSTTADHNIVTFDGVRGRVLAASATQLSVEVPACLPSRNARVTASLGIVQSAAQFIAVTSTAGASLELAPGQAATFSGPAQLGCLRMPATPNALYLVASHHIAAGQTPPVALSLRSVAAQGIFAGMPVAETPAPFEQQWEARLRARERLLSRGIDDVAAGMQAQPELGDRRTFNVLNQQERFDKVTAAVRLITQRAIFYVDVEAATSLTDAELQGFGTLFDDPIHATTVGIFGQPSDIDGNGKVLILLSPRINALTPRGSGSFIAGYFYGCDLVSVSRCSGTNRAEVFYSLVPDVSGKWGDIRSTATVMTTVPTVIAHEFQHMINFAARESTESLWLSEGLAHTAEEAVATALAARGDHAAAARFMAGNYGNAQRFLASTSGVNLLSEEPPGTLESRGAAWLFLKYLRGHYGGDDFLRRVNASERVGAANIAAEAAQPWSKLRTDFGLAIWADGAPEVQGTLDPKHRFVGFNLRNAIGAPVFPLRPVVRQWADFNAGVSVTSGGHAYSLLRAPVVATPLALLLADPWGRYPGDDVALTIMRVQ